MIWRSHPTHRGGGARITQRVLDVSRCKGQKKKKIKTARAGDAGVSSKKRGQDRERQEIHTGAGSEGGRGYNRARSLALHVLLALGSPLKAVRRLSPVAVDLLTLSHLVLPKPLNCNNSP